ncbi:PREDICTED: uncharacterized protein LOC104753181 [Camelina sativa]|uniref:Uncharacterized protein LOC104753181 n=1 Tax=Camelina sativa TaxID=90675 RepID=A0ABM1R3W1_CAMSA|nr:PREDICTED: uncharacterized protein LOC104753181 [Camelina sativa]
MSTSIVQVGYRYESIRATVARNDSDISDHVRIFLSNDENRNKIIGLDTERSVLQCGIDYPPESRLVVLQLCDGQNCLIIPVRYVCGNKLPVSLTNILNLPEYTFMGVGISKALEMLKSECGLTCKNAVDIGPSSWTLLSKSLGKIKRKSQEYLSFREPIPEAIYEDWDSGSLSENQIKLATANAHLAFEVENMILENTY